MIGQMFLDHCQSSRLWGTEFWTTTSHTIFCEESSTTSHSFNSKRISTYNPLHRKRTTKRCATPNRVQNSKGNGTTWVINKNMPNCTKSHYHRADKILFHIFEISERFQPHHFPLSPPILFIKISTKLIRFDYPFKQTFQFTLQFFQFITKNSRTLNANSHDLMKLNLRF